MTTIIDNRYNPTNDWLKLLSGAAGMAGAGMGMDPGGSAIRGLLGNPDPASSQFAQWDQIARQAAGDGDDPVWYQDDLGNLKHVGWSHPRDDWAGTTRVPVPGAITGSQAAAIARRKASAFAPSGSGARTVPYKPMSLGEFWRS